MHSLNISKEKAYNTIIKPIVTEKSTLLLENNQVVFLVDVNSNKIDIKKSIELIFGVKVSAVNVIKVKGKTKRFKGTLGKRPDYKKAIISLPDGQSIDLSAGV
ncbi:MAG: 50S ribosomal protein L23 [Candidatus Puniceispirillales bacterium]